MVQNSGSGRPKLEACESHGSRGPRQVFGQDDESKKACLSATRPSLQHGSTPRKRSPHTSLTPAASMLRLDEVSSTISSCSVAFRSERPPRVSLFPQGKGRPPAHIPDPNQAHGVQDWDRQENEPEPRPCFNDLSSRSGIANITDDNGGGRTSENADFTINRLSDKQVERRRRRFGAASCRKLPLQDIQNNAGEEDTGSNPKSRKCLRRHTMSHIVHALSVEKENCSSLEQPHTPIVRKKSRKSLIDSETRLKLCESSEKPKARPAQRQCLARSSTFPLLGSPDISQLETSQLLPTIESKKHPDLRSVSPTTVMKLLRGGYKDKVKDFLLVDCRFPYEYEQGHIRGAISIFHPDKLEAMFLQNVRANSQKTVYIFYCEFSANRAPRMVRHLRTVDRKIHINKYPHLYYPELYIVDGGYKNCFEKAPEICSSPSYLTMDDKKHVHDCKKYFSNIRLAWKKRTKDTIAKLVSQHLEGFNARSVSAEQLT